MKESRNERWSKQVREVYLRELEKINLDVTAQEVLEIKPDLEAYRKHIGKHFEWFEKFFKDNLK